MESNISPAELADRDFESVQAKDVAPKTEWKYRADLRKLKEFCAEADRHRRRMFSV